MIIEIAPGLLIRDVREDDVEAIVRYANNPRVAAHLRDRFPHPYEEHHAREWIQATRAAVRPTHFVIADDREVIGGIGLIPGDDVYRLSAELGYWLGEPFWNKGITTSAVKAMTTFGLQSLELARIQALVFEGNEASGRVLEKAGYRLEGTMRRAVVKRGRILDQYLYAATPEPDPQ